MCIRDRKILIIKLGATGDVVRTTPLLTKFEGPITWLTGAKNAGLLHGLKPNLRCVSWEDRHLIPDIRYDLVINLEDSLEVAAYHKTLQFSRLYGAYAGPDNKLLY